MNEPTYVFHDTEVKLTGRTADRQVTTKAKRRSTGTLLPDPPVNTLHEITPVDQLNGSWRKWVRMVELYEIK